MLLFALFALVQKGHDQIVFHNGDLWQVTILEQTQDRVKFRREGEQLIRSHPMNFAIDKLVYATGQVYDLPDPPLEQIKAHWAYVVVTEDPNAVVGLHKIRHQVLDLRSKNRRHSDAFRAEVNKVKKTAASVGGFIILLKSRVNRDGSRGMIGEIYKFEERIDPTGE